MAVNKLDPKIIFASEAPAQDVPAVFANKTVGWGESRKNGGRPTIKQSNALQQETDLKILWLNENAVTPYDASIDYPVNAVTIQDGTFKIFNGATWDIFLNKFSVGLGNVDNTSDLNKPIPDSQIAINKLGGVDYWREINKPYPLNGEVRLLNGDVVTSTVADNINNPNVDMTGWVSETKEIVKSINELQSKKPSRGNLETVASYHLDKNTGGGEFICIQSSVLIDNGVTLFRSNVIGYEDHFFARLDQPTLTVEMAGALPDPTFNSREAFHRCTKLGGAFKLISGASYLAEHPQTDPNLHVIPYYDKAIKFYSDAEPATITCSHTYPSTTPYAIGIADFSLRCPSFVLDGVYVIGHKTAGHLPKSQRCWGVEIRGCDHYNVRNSKFSTMSTHNLYVARQLSQNWFTTNPNTSEAISALNALNSKNGTIEDNIFEHVGSTPCGIFGASDLHFRRNKVDINGALYDFLFFTDDASSQTALADYATNDNIYVYDNIAPDATLDINGLASGAVYGNDVKHIKVRSYDFDQQRNNFNSTSHTYNPNDHLETPFLWMRYISRGVSVYNNRINTLDIQSAFVDSFNNIYTSAADGQSLQKFMRNSVLWGTGVSYYDDIDASGNQRYLLTRGNTYYLNHNTCICNDYGSTFVATNFGATGSLIYKVSPATTFTHLRYSNNRYRKDEYKTIDSNYVNDFVNHPLDIKHTMLTQGIGTNCLKTYTCYRGGQGAIPVMSFTATANNIVARIVITASNGNVLEKKATITPAGVLTLINTDGVATWDTGVFTTTIDSGVVSLNVNIASGVEASFDIQAVGRWADAVFVIPATRLASTG